MTTNGLYKSPEGYQTIMRWYDSVLAKFPVPYESQFVETRYGPTHVLVMGDPGAPPLLLLQGMAGSAALDNNGNVVFQVG